MKNAWNVRNAFMLISITAISSGSVHAFMYDPVFAPFSELLEEFDPYSRPVKSRENAEKDLQAYIKTLQDEAKRLAKAADELAIQFDKKPTGGEIPVAFDAVADSHAAIGETMRNIKKGNRAVHRARRAEAIQKAPSYSLRTSTDDKQTAFVVTASLPGLSKDDLKISVKSANEFGKERQTLYVTGKQEAKLSDDQKYFSASAITQARYINGRREELAADNGNVSIVVDLPEDASNDLVGVEKTMTLENGLLTLSFPLDKNKKRKKEIELRFTSQNDQQTAKEENQIK